MIIFDDNTADYKKHLIRKLQKLNTLNMTKKKLNHKESPKKILLQNNNDSQKRRDDHSSTGKMLVNDDLRNYKIECYRYYQFAKSRIEELERINKALCQKNELLRNIHNEFNK